MGGALSMRNKILILGCVAWMGLTALAYSANTSAAPFTQVPVSVRMMGLCGAGTALGDPATAYNNPAVLGYSENSEISAVHGSILDSVPFMGLSYNTAPEALWGMTGGLNFVNVNLGDFKEAKVDQTTGEIWQTGRTFGYNGFNLSGALAKKINNALSVGLTLKVVREALDDSSASGFGLDLGAYYKWDDKLSFAFALQNLIAPQLAWDTDDKTVESMALRPLAGVAYNAWRELTLVADVYSGSDQKLGYSVGAEYLLSEMFTVRAGTDLQRFSLGSSLHFQNLLVHVSFSPDLNSSMGAAYFVGGTYVFEQTKVVPVPVPAPIPVPEPAPVPEPIATPAEPVTTPVPEVQPQAEVPTVEVPAALPVTETIVTPEVQSVVTGAVEVPANPGVTTPAAVVPEVVPATEVTTAAPVNEAEDVMSRENFLKRNADF